MEKKKSRPAWSRGGVCYFPAVQKKSSFVKVYPEKQQKIMLSGIS
jgi:hypothetical protein